MLTGMFTVYKIVDGFPGSVASPSAAQESDLKSGDAETSKPVLLASLSEEVSPSPYSPESDKLRATDAVEQDVSEPLALSPESKPEESADQMISEFYNQLGEGNIDAAYDRLSPKFREVLSYHRFKQGYENVDALSCEVKNSTPINNDKVRLDVEIQVTEAGAPSTYWATCVVIKNGMSWRLDGVAQIES